MSWTPLPVVVLGLDPARVSGWAILVDGQLAASGTARSASERAQVVSTAQTASEAHQRRLVVVAERWLTGGWASFDAIAGLAAAWGAWREALEIAGHPKRRVVRVTPQTWRASLLGGRATREEWKRRAVWRVRAEHGIEVSDDEAEAVLIGQWGSRSLQVARLLPKARSA